MLAANIEGFSGKERQREVVTRAARLYPEDDPEYRLQDLKPNHIKNYALSKLSN